MKTNSQCWALPIRAQSAAARGHPYTRPTWGSKDSLFLVPPWTHRPVKHNLLLKKQIALWAALMIGTLYWGCDAPLEIKTATLCVRRIWKWVLMGYLRVKHCSYCRKSNDSLFLVGPFLSTQGRSILMRKVKTAPWAAFLIEALCRWHFETLASRTTVLCIRRLSLP